VRKGDDNTSLDSPLHTENKLQLVHKGDDNTSLHSLLAADETLYMRPPVRQGDDNTIQGFVLRLKKDNLDLQHKTIYQRKL
jgi:hypothetical protein